MLRYSNINRFSGTKSFRSKMSSKIKTRNTSSSLSTKNWTTSFNYLEPEIVAPKNVYSSQHSLQDGQVVWNDATPEQLRFMQTVYDINYARYSQRRSPYTEIPENELESVISRYKLRKEAAQKFKELLTAAKAAIKANNVNTEIALNSAYRSPEHQFNLWMDYFPNYYNETKTHRESLEGGQHGDKAAQYLARYVRARISTPGFSNHNNGLAVDIRNTENGAYIRNSSRPTWIEKWKSSWLWSWLVANANTYNFYQETSINEPWHWVYRE